MTANSTTSGAAAAAAAGGGAPRGPSTDEVMVYWLDIALLCVVGAFFLVFLPRAIARFSSFSEWTRGLVLRSGAPNSAADNSMVQHISPAARLHRMNTMTTLVDNDSDQSHTLANHDAIYTGYNSAVKEKQWAAPMSFGVSSPPKHVPALASLLHPLSTPFSYPVSPSKSLGKLVIMGAYLGAILFIVFFDGGNPLASTNRLGYIAMSQIPVAVALGTKNNVVGMLLGMGYERLNFLHRWVGVITFGAANMHAIGYFYKWAINETLGEEFQTPLVMHGMIGLSGVTLLFLTSQAFVRQRAYTLFLFAHITGIILFFVGICFHEPVCTKYVLLGVGIYALDHIFRLIKTRISTARISAIPELGLTRVEIRGVAAGWRAGQHVRLRVLSGEMGALGWSVAHPFTIASAGGDSSADSDRGLVLMCKKAGGWTNRLYAAAASRAPGAYAVEDGYGHEYGAQREMRVIVEGPYGGLGNMVMSSYSSVLLVTGGSGLTFALGQAEELVQAINNRKSAVKFIELVWITQDRASLNPLLPAFSALLSSVAHIPGVVMRITTHYTRPDKVSPPNGSAKPSGPNASTSTSTSASLDAHLATLAPNLTLHPGRPSLPRILAPVAHLTSSIPRASGLAVAVCGPLGLVQEVRYAVRSVDGELRSACGGVELHEEVFGW